MVMPNHMHGIVCIGEMVGEPCRGAACCAPFNDGTDILATEKKGAASGALLRKLHPTELHLQHPHQQSHLQRRRINIRRLWNFNDVAAARSNIDRIAVTVFQRI